MECRYALRGFGINIEGFENDDTKKLSESVSTMVQKCQEMDQRFRQKQKAILLPQPNDVLLGRGRPFQLYSGNLALTATIDRYRTEYTSSKKMHKKAITAEIVSNILLSGGRFLKKVNSDRDTGIDWEVVDFETARLKVSHSFRTLSKWHAENDDEGKGNQSDGQRIGSDEGSVESIPPITADETSSLGFIVKSESFNHCVETNRATANNASSNKRRRGGDA
eukprot:jgi/Psemu1/308325/fgenesh1_kg.400_\